MNPIRREAAPVRGYRQGMLDDQFTRMVESVFEDMFAPFVGASASGAQEGTLMPRLSLSENEQAYDIEAEVPGVDKDNVRIAIDGRRVSIEAEQRFEQSGAGGQQAGAAGQAAAGGQTGPGGGDIVTRSLRRYARSFTLPQEVDEERAQARLEHGILHLTLPKKQAGQGKVLAIQ